MTFKFVLFVLLILFVAYAMAASPVVSDAFNLTTFAATPDSILYYFNNKDTSVVCSIGNLHCYHIMTTKVTKPVWKEAADSCKSVIIDSILHPADEFLSDQPGLYNMSGNFCNLDLRPAINISAYQPDSVIALNPNLTGTAGNAKLDVTGFRLVDNISDEPSHSATAEDSTLITDYDNLLQQSKNISSVYVEGGLSIMYSTISSDVDEIDQYGYDVEDGYESDIVYARIGAGHQLKNFGLYCYGDYTKYYAGFLFYQRTPYSPALLRYNMQSICYGIELRVLDELRLRAGYGHYNGNIEVGAENSSSSESWSTNIDEGSGFHWSAGVLPHITKDLMCCFEFSHHEFDITPHATQTPAMVTDQHISKSNIAISLVYNVASIHW